MYEEIGLVCMCEVSSGVQVLCQVLVSLVLVFNNKPLFLPTQILSCNCDLYNKNI